MQRNALRSTDNESCQKIQARKADGQKCWASLKGMRGDLRPQPSRCRILRGAYAAELDKALCQRVVCGGLGDARSCVDVHILKAVVPGLLVQTRQIDDDIRALDGIPDVGIIPDVEVLVCVDLRQAHTSGNPLYSCL